MQSIVEIARFTDRVGALTDFYARFLGVAPLFANESMAIFRIGTVQILIHSNTPADPAYGFEAGPPNEDHWALGVEDLTACCARLIDEGVEIDRMPEQYPWGRSAYLRDPDGRLIEIQETPADE